MGVMIEAGIVKEGTPICVPSKEVSTRTHVTSIVCKWLCTYLVPDLGAREPHTPVVIVSRTRA